MMKLLCRKDEIDPSASREVNRKGERFSRTHIDPNVRFSVGQRYILVSPCNAIPR